MGVKFAHALGAEVTVLSHSANKEADAKNMGADHRIGLTVYNLPTVLDGEIGEFIEQLRIAENTERLTEGAA